MLHATPRPLLALVSASLDRLTLVANHVLRAEPQATERLRAHAGCRVDASGLLPALVPTWAMPAEVLERGLTWRITPAGLLERADEATEVVAGSGGGASVPASDAAHEAVTLRFTTESVTHIARAWARQDPTVVEVQGPEPVAQSVRWVVQNVRWDYAADVERMMPRAVGAPAARAAEALAGGVAKGVRTIESWWSRPPGQR